MNTFYVKTYCQSLNPFLLYFTLLYGSGLLPHVRIFWGFRFTLSWQIRLQFGYQSYGLKVLNLIYIKN